MTARPVMRSASNGVGPPLDGKPAEDCEAGVSGPSLSDGGPAWPVFDGQMAPPAGGIGVLVGVAVSVTVAVGVIVGVSLGVAVGVMVGVLVGVLVGVDVGVLVGVLLGVDVGVLVGVLLGVAVGVGVHCRGFWVGAFPPLLLFGAGSCKHNGAATEASTCWACAAGVASVPERRSSGSNHNSTSTPHAAAMALSCLILSRPPVSGGEYMDAAARTRAICGKQPC
jgi:hypothetical protein